MPLEWCHEGGVESKVKKQLKGEPRIMDSLGAGKVSSGTGINCLILLLIFLSVLSSGDLWQDSG